MLMKVNASVNRRGLVTFLAAGLLTAYWHIPANFDAAVLNDNVHIMMHATFTIVGALMFIGAGLLTGRMRHILLLVPGKAMGIFGAFLMFTSLICISCLPGTRTNRGGIGDGGHDAPHGCGHNSVLALQIFRKQTDTAIFHGQSRRS